MVTAPPAGDEEVQAMTEHQRESEWNVADWHCKMLVDCNDGKIGELQDVYVDVETDEPHRSFLSCGFCRVSPRRPRHTTHSSTSRSHACRGFPGTLLQ